MFKMNSIKIKNLLVFIMLFYKRFDQIGRKYITETDLTPNVIVQRNKYFLHRSKSIYYFLQNVSLEY